MAKVAAKKKSSGKKKSASKKTAPKKKSAKAKGRPGKSPKKVPAVAVGQDGMGSFLLEHSPDGIVAVDRAGTIRYINSAAEKLLKIKSAKMVGQKFRYPVDTSRPQEVSISESGHRERVAEIRAMESRMGRETIFVISLRDITDRVNMEAQLRALSDVDPLTGLLNRRGFVEAANRQLTLAQRQKWGMTLFFLDLDGLKWINDEFGHLEGDQALIETAAILRKTVRRPDILGRYAGDEFTILAFEGADSSDSSDKIAERLRINLETHNERKRPDRKISFSIGVARYNPINTPILDNLIDDADFKMYEEKRSKRRAR